MEKKLKIRKRNGEPVSSDLTPFCMVSQAGNSTLGFGMDSGGREVYTTLGRK